ncbi:hypothetical protein BBD41_03395 [Paenibacillus ihbetae]|uniref:Pectate lyase superfamily protein domain-containing protein n=1 Tax=Paenibacillus ihbetae TaxID=1870820 RepID=A0A1B2DVE8_9BACL|nr:hypothetical protein [Paenibacillus ihbetae]ANY71702.1 hypothetical protein BBD41_03395 [Paenibacillus ihbetae]
MINNKDVNPVNIIDTGKADPTGSSNNFEAIRKALAVNTTDSIFIPKGTYLITQNITFPSSKKIIFDRNARLKPSLNTVVTINGSWDANTNDQIFDLSLGGEINGDFRVEKIYPEWFGAKRDGITDDTTPFQKALDTGKHVHGQGGSYKVSNLVVSTNNQIISFASNSKLISTSLGDVVTLKADYCQLINATINTSGSVKNAIKTQGFRVTLKNCTVEGKSENALVVDGLETIVLFGNYKGGSIAGIKVQKPDLYLQNVYLEFNTHGLYSNGVGSITGYHVHSYNNKEMGFYLVGADFSQFTACYADTNGRNGWQIQDTVNGFSLIDCWSYKSSNVYAYENDFAIRKSKNIKLIGCRSSGMGSEPKLAGFNIDSLSQVDLIGCYSDSPVNGIVENNAIRLTNCSGSLSRYNRSADTYQSQGLMIEDGATIDVNIKTLIPQPLTTPGILSFDICSLIRNDDNSDAFIQKNTLIIAKGFNVSSPVTTDSASRILISSPAFVTKDDGFNYLSFRVTNQKKRCQVAFNVQYLGTGRGFI